MFLLQCDLQHMLFFHIRSAESAVSVDISSSHEASPTEMLLKNSRLKWQPMSVEWVSGRVGSGHGPQTCTEACREDNVWVMEPTAVSWLLHGTFSLWTNLAHANAHVVPVKSLHRAGFDWISYTIVQEEEHISHSHQFLLSGSSKDFTGISTNHFMASGLFGQRSCANTVCPS